MVETKAKGDDTLQILLMAVNKLMTKMKAQEDSGKQFDERLKTLEDSEKQFDEQLKTLEDSENQE